MAQRSDIEWPRDLPAQRGRRNRKNVMSGSTGIEWTDATWNPVRGCTRVSEGCRNCYAEIMAARFNKRGQWGHGFATTVLTGNPSASTIDHRWTGKVELIESQLDLPLRWKKPQRIFVNSTSDLFHESLPFEKIRLIFNIMRDAPHHTYQVLTKRALQMVAFTHWYCAQEVESRLPSNIWLGVSVEDQERADERIPQLLQTPARTRFISAEPLLGPLDIVRYLVPPMTTCQASTVPTATLAAIGRAAVKHVTGEARYVDWVIAGGESGHDARPMHPDWARALRDQCTAAGVPFFFKQWGEFGCLHQAKPGDKGVIVDDAGTPMVRVGKARAGRLLDGIEHNAFPTVAS